MEQRAPRTAAFASTVSTMSMIALLGNAFLGMYPGQDGQRVLLKPLFTGFVSGNTNDYWAPTGWSQQEWIWLFITACLIIIVFWGRSERPVPELPQRRSVEEQIAAFESSSTVVGTRQVTNVSQQTSSIITSIIGESLTIDSKRVESATELLSKGDFGTQAASIVSKRNTDIESRLFEPQLQEKEMEEIATDDRDFVTDGPAYVPLPGAEARKDPPPLFRDQHTAFVTDGPAHIPLPELPDMEESEKNNVPDMPSLDDLLGSSGGVPQMPNLDDLF